MQSSSSQEPPHLANSGKLDVVLVHGTFANDATWILSTGKLASAITAEWPTARVVPFRWNGRNSHTERRKAGAALASCIQDLNRNSPDARRIVIAHSHGGNVALLAQSDIEFIRAVDAIVFLGTPFLTVRLRSLDPIIPVLCAVIPIILVAGLAIYSTLFTLLFMASALLCYLPLPRKLAIELWGLWRDWIGRSLEAVQKVALRRIYIPALRIPGFVASSRRDEAAAWLTALTRAPAFVARLAGVFRGILAFWWVILGFAFLMGPLSTIKGTNAVTSAIAGVVMAPLTLLAASIGIYGGLQILLIATSTALRGHRFGFGWEGVLSSIVVEINVSRYPCSLSDVTLHELNSHSVRSAMHHSAYYDDDETISRAIGWISSVPLARQRDIDSALAVQGRMQAERDTYWRRGSPSPTNPDSQFLSSVVAFRNALNQQRAREEWERLRSLTEPPIERLDADVRRDNRLALTAIIASSLLDSCWAAFGLNTLRSTTPSKPLKLLRPFARPGELRSQLFR